MFRINLYLDFFKYIKSFFLFKNINFLEKKVSKILTSQSNKKYTIFTSQARVGFLYILKFLKLQNKEKNEIIFSAYNLPEMVNLAKNLNYNVRFCDIDPKTGSMDEKQLPRLINNQTKAIVLTNMYNDFRHSKKIKSIVEKKNIFLIEDNAIYFDNFSKYKNKKYYSGSTGNFSIYSFNIMKNVSAMYGGAVTTNNEEFKIFFNKENKNLRNFPYVKLINQTLIFLTLKIMSNNFLYKNLFIYIIKKSHFENNKFVLKLFYPSLKFKIINFPKYYFTKLSKISLKLIFLQIQDTKQRNINYISRRKKNDYYYKKFLKLNNKNIKLISIKDSNYQNFLDFPILVKNKEKLNKFLLRNDIETKLINYRNCEKIFNKSNTNCKYAEYYANKLISLPNHRKITYEYIDKIIKKINIFSQNESTSQ